MEGIDKSPSAKEERKREDEEREEDDVLVVDIDEGREKSAARRQVQKSRVSRPPTLI